MNTIQKLATSLGRRDEIPNQELAMEIFLSRDKKAIIEIIDHLANKDKNIQSDCIKVLYELGRLESKLIQQFASVFLDLLQSKNNRMIWGAMMALNAIASENQETIYRQLSKILAASDHGSVITKDHAIGILIKLATNKSYSDEMLELLHDQFKSCAINQLAMYAEQSIQVITKKHKARFIKLFISRLNEIDKDSKKKRILNVIKKLELKS